MTRNFNESASDASTKVPEVTLAFWIIKIAATTLGETGSDSVTMTFDWGYLTGHGDISAGAGGSRYLPDHGEEVPPVPLLGHNSSLDDL
jgi:Repeat of Unknown Function (DUF347)